VNSGGNKIKLRIVKGANLATEKVESSQNLWQCPIYTSKVETDANFKSVLNYCLQKKLAKRHRNWNSNTQYF
jgi:RHH-type proline utilization regulon transcriptional repressor/proline dehydrogenase/delta 1-pyrroline-5-carboxylate dehydrogenase